jgi:carboxypeptidase Taq
MKHYLELENICSRMTILGNAGSILAWDVAVNIPQNSIETCSEQMSLLQVISHELLTSNKLGDCLANIDLEILDPWQKRNVELVTKSRDLALLLDPRLITSFTNATSISEMKWRDARKNNDYKSYMPYLAEVVKLTKEITIPKAEKLGCSLYDALIDNYEPNLSSKKIEPIFAKLESFLKDFIPEVMDHQKKNNYDMLTSKLEISDEIQFALGKKFMDLLGFDFSRGRLDLSTHPQCGGYRDDTRITTRFDKNDLISGLMGVVHETGHALYNQNLPSKMKNQPVGSCIGMAMHESQSLIMEMQVGRSREFLNFASKQIKAITGHNIDEFEASSLFKKVNRVNPDFIRVDADEVTYPAHIIMRYKIERQIIEGNLDLKDLPEVWQIEQEKILGIRPPSNRLGCLQDIHWPAGLFGYFPSYSIGAIMSAAFFDTAKSKIPGLTSDIESGNFTKLVGWLNENIHSQGLLYYSEELLKKATGKELDVDLYINYLKNKFLA